MNTFSKIIKSSIFDELTKHANKFLQIFVGAYIKLYSSQHVLIHLIEEWKTQLDKNKIVGAVLLDLSKTFDCIPHDLLITKLDAYGFDKEVLSLIYSYLKNRKRSVRIINVQSIFLELISGVPQGSFLGTLLFNIFLNGLYFFITKASLHNSADDNTLSAYSSDLNSLTDILTEASQTTLIWLKANYMIVNPKRFQAMLVSKRKNTIPEDLTISIYDVDIKPNNSVKFLGITLDNKLNFVKHISSICKSASCQLNVLFRLKNFLGFKERKILIESFVYSSMNYCPIVWHFWNQTLSQKVENLLKRAL